MRHVKKRTFLKNQLSEEINKSAPDFSSARPKAEKKKKIGWIILILSLTGIILCGAFIINYYAKQENASEYYSKLQTIRQESAQSVDLPIDFQDLQKENADIYAWITIPGTAVDYPIVQSPTDDFYYLNHTVNGIKGYPGSIYTEMANNKEFTDFNTVIYGHNMKDGSMFGALHQYEDKEFFNNKGQIIIYSENQILYYDIFAVYQSDSKHILNTNSFSSLLRRQEYLEEIMAESFINHDDSIKVTPRDKIITLSTCTASGDNTRFLVQAVLAEKAAAV